MPVENLGRVLGVELNRLEENQFSCRYCLLEREKENLNIELQKIVEGTLVEVLASLPKNHPIALTLTGKGIIHKNVQLSGASESESLFQQTFAGIEPQDFYRQHFGQEEYFLISIIRKQVIDELLGKCKGAGLRVFALSLGGIVTAPIWSQLNCYGRELQFDGHVFDTSTEGQFKSYRMGANVKARFLLKLEQEPIVEEHVLAYASAFQLILHEKLSLIVADVDSVHQEFSAFLENASLKKKVLLFLGVLFGLLLISFLVFGYYNQQNVILNGQVGEQVTSADQIDLLQKSNAEQIALLGELHWNGGFNYGFLMDEIGEELPRQVQLTAIDMKIKPEQEKLTAVPTLDIKGKTTNLTAVNNWIFVLKDKPWIKSVRLIKYQEDQESEAFQFNIQLTY
ncbi:hypothetical protein GM921_09780 [Pedobacter sp. LMG 31464]|uniref:Fimbrial assembly protein (PilN) n=1 Tax=Pedobacter planticolens TaxID=2679964 RepID=A0A923DXD1_9SPHI|nr:PilN domain-containing protein [Pedobacter planticolens]MBB2145776.1 hypothetical protein [Pedobacter planticolens]